uniref:Uncharacterized protein n=1 Tax=Parascaris univalens TaxID=6257 RepID=A0A915A2M7_PARUN
MLTERAESWRIRVSSTGCFELLTRKTAYFALFMREIPMFIFISLLRFLYGNNFTLPLSRSRVLSLLYSLTVCLKKYLFICSSFFSFTCALRKTPLA